MSSMPGRGLNMLRTKIKKNKNKNQKKDSDPTPISNSSVASSSERVVGIGGGGFNSQAVLIGLLAKENNKRKAASVCTPPDLPSPVHSQPRKLSSDSPSHSSARPTPTSPLVNAKLSGLTPTAPRRDPNNILTPSNGSVSTSGYPLPKVNVASEDQPLDRQGIIDITVNVQSFLAAISNLKKAMTDSDIHRDDDMRDREASTRSPSSPSHSLTSIAESPDTDSILSHVTNLIEVVTTCLNEHSSMQSTEIKDAAKDLLNTYQNCGHINPNDCTVCNTSIDSLIDAFTNSVSEYLTGESAQTDSSILSIKDQLPQKKGLERVGLKGLSKSHDNLTAKYNSYIDLSQQFSEPILDDIDQALFGIEDSIEVAARYIKARMKYHKEIVSYLSKRAQIIFRYVQSTTNLCSKTTRAIQEMAEDHPFPLINTFRQSVEQDMWCAARANTTYNHQMMSRIMEPLEQKINECEKRKKELTTTWRNEKKKLIEAKTTMKNAMSKYQFLGQDLSRVKNLALDPHGKHVEKRKKEVSDLETRWQEAEVAYKNAVADCNDCQYQVHVVARRSILCAYRRMVIELDIQLQSCLDTYFTLQQNFFTSLPEPMAKYLVDVKAYKIGSEFKSFVERHPEQREEPEDYLFEEFDPEADALLETNDNYMLPDTSSTHGFPISTSSDSTFLNPGADDIIDRAPSPACAFDPVSQANLSLTDTRQPFSISSPQMTKKRIRPQSDVVEMVQFDSPQNSIIRRNSDHTRWGKDTLSPPTVTSLHQPTVQDSIVYSKVAQTHNFKKLRGPSRCRECDTYVYFHGHECDTCGLACHKKCLQTLSIRCGSKRLARKMTTFGVDFHKHLKATKRYIPIIVTKCIEEIDERALDTQGLYRISSAKTKLEHLCQLFESGADRVDLSDRPSHLIGSCLKLYFRQLPEPLLTFELYHDFITFARECSYILPCNLDMVTGEKKQTALEMLERLKKLLQSLPYENYITVAKLLYHLNKVSHPDHVKHNFMPPSNLGIVFGPNLLRQREVVASLALLADMTAQAKAIEIMISHVHQLFHITEEKFKEAERGYDNDYEFKEVNVDEPTRPVKSPQLMEIDATTAGSRTPYNTPPERRRENVFELGEVLEVLQSVGRRNSDTFLQPVHHSPLGDIRECFMSASSPSFTTPFPSSVGSDDSTLNNLSRFLRASSVNPLEKMLTPVEERPAAEFENDPNPFSDDEEDEDFAKIISSTSNKIDRQNMSRSASAQSSSGVLWTVDSEVSSVRDNVSILSGVDGERQQEYFKDVSILGGDDEQKESSQSSDDSNAFSEPPLSQVANNTEATHGVPYSNQRHDLFTDPSSRLLKHSDHYSGSQHSSPLSSTSRATVSSQSSMSELVTGEDSSTVAETKLKKYSISEKYAKYEQWRLLKALSDDKVEKTETTETVEHSQNSTQESNGTLTDEQGKHSPPLEGDSKTEAIETPHLNEEGHNEIPHLNEEHIETHDTSVGKNALSNDTKLDKKLNYIKDSSKHCDSGIDDTPESNRSFKGGTRRSSMPPSEEDMPFTDIKPLSHISAFTSRESGLADSPDPELLNDEVLLHKVHHHHPQEEHETRTGGGEEDKLKIIHKSSETEIQISMGEDSSSSKMNDHSVLSCESCDNEAKQLESLDDDQVSNSYSFERGSFERGNSVSSFNRYARTPIRDIRLLRASESPQRHMTGLKYRSVSMDKIPSSMEKSGIDSRAFSLSGSKSTSFTPHQPSRHVPLNTKNTQCHADQQFSTNSPSPTNLSLDLTDTSPSHSNSPMGSFQSDWIKKGLKKRFKPALRVFKITPTSAVSPSPILAQPPQEEEEVEDDDVCCDSTPISPVGSSPRTVIVRRVRMMSPEAVTTHLMPSKMNLRRSQSSEDILESSLESKDDEYPETKIGSLLIVPEPKHKHRASFLKGKRPSSPDVRSRSEDHGDGVDAAISPLLLEFNRLKSSKTKRRNRTPAFV